MRAERTWRRPWRVAVLATLVALGLVVATELAARRLLADTPASFHFRSFVPGESRVGFLTEDRQTAYALAAEYRESARHAGAYATGAWAGRGGPPPPGSGHVAVFGDSCVYGVGVRTSETLPARIESALARDGQSTVRVVNYGTPGFSSEQVRARLRVVLREHRPRAAVFYLSSWNDQARAILASDEAILSRLGGSRAWIRGSALGRLARRALPTPSEPSENDSVRTEARVPPERFAENVQALLSACRDAGVAPIIVLPAYPQHTSAKHPRLDQDRERARRTAKEEGVLVLDARDVLHGAGLDDGVAFVDFVHPSPAAHAALGDAVAALLRGSDPATDPPSGPLTIRAVDPPRACSLGDVTVSVRLEGLSAGERPELLVGGAPLLDVRDLGHGRFEGMLMANGPGRHDLVVQGRQGLARLAQALELWEPHLELDESGTLAFVARPGDEALVVAARERLPQPVVEPRGSAWLAPDTLLASFPGLVMDAHGRALVPLAPDTGGPDARWFQALVSPAGSGPHAKRYSALFDRTAGPR